MTVTFPSAGMTARRPRGGAATADRPLRRGLARAAAAVAVALLVAVGGAQTASAATSTPTPTPSPSASPAPSVGFTLSPVGSGIVEGGKDLAVSLTVTNQTEVALSAGSLTVELGSTAITDRARLESWLAGDATGTATREVVRTSAPAVEPGSMTTQGVAVAAIGAASRPLTAGVYPLLARYERAGVELTSTSALIVPRTTGKVTPVGVLVPITAGPITAGVYTADELETLTADDGALTAQLDAVSGTAAILAVDPAIPASIRILGSAAPASATAWLARLEALPNERFALQFGDADVASQLAAGIDEPLQPTTLQPYVSSTDFPVTTPTPQPTPTATEQPAAPDYPDLATLLGIGRTDSTVYWPVPGTADTATVEKLGALGESDEAPYTIVPSATTGSAAAANPARAQVGKSGAAALVYDSAISAALSQASATDENVLRGRPLTAAAALLSLASLSAGESPLLVTVDRGADRSRVSLGSAVRVVEDLASTRPATLGELERAPARTVTISAAEPDAQHTAVAASLVRGEEELSAFATILSDPTQITGRERAEILQVLGAGWFAAPDAWDEAVAAHREATSTTLDAVSILPPTSVNLATSDASLRYWVRNDLPYPIDLVLYATPDDLRLDVQHSTQIAQATPLSNTRVGVPVKARLSNGEVTIQLQLRSPAGVPIGSAAFADVNVRADWEGIGVAVVLILVGGFIAVGLARTILRRRGARRAQAAEITDTPPEEPR